MIREPSGAAHHPPGFICHVLPKPGGLCTGLAENLSGFICHILPDSGGLRSGILDSNRKALRQCCFFFSHVFQMHFQTLQPGWCQSLLCTIQRKRQHSLKQIPVYNQLKPSVHQLRQAFCYRNAKAASFGISGAVAAHEPFH